VIGHQGARIMTTASGSGAGEPGDWYQLFSRGARDWLRHNQKVREAVRDKLPDLISQADILGSSGSRRVLVPVRILEHYRFRLDDTGSRTGVGQGAAEPGAVLAPARGARRGPGKGAGGSGEGALEFVLEFTIDDIVDWLWEELDLPNLRMKPGAIRDDEYLREGWDRRGVRSRLDKRRSLKESIKRRAIQKDGPIFADDDLRYRQLVRRERPAYEAVVFFVMDVSASMGDQDRRLAKTFFFWVVQGLRRQYTDIECVFIAHTDKAWEFSEEEFFQVRGFGGTVASTAFDLALEKIEERYSPSRYNVYLFYASDGENFGPDREGAQRALSALSKIASYLGFVETVATAGGGTETEMARLFAALTADNAPAGVYFLREQQDVWDAIKAFFRQQAAHAA
jgi:sporulation protein YhbH